jgi:hypothetical protein
MVRRCGRKPSGEQVSDAPPDLTAFPGRMGVRAGGSASHAQRDDAPVADDRPRSDDLMDVTARTRLAYETARARNMSSLPGSVRTPPQPPAATRREVTPIRNPYSPTTSPRPTLRQTTIPETIGRAPRPAMPERIDTSTHDRGNDQGFGVGRPVVGGPIISPRHRDRDLRARHLGASRYDVLKLACSEYHIGMDGVPLLTEDILEAR